MCLSVLNELAEENNYSTTPVAMKTRSKTSNSFKPISLSSIKTDKNLSIAKNLLNNNLKVTQHLNKLVLKPAPVIVKQRAITLGFAAPFLWHSSCAAISAKDIKK